VHPTVLAGLRRFPLVGQARPTCPTLDLRLQEVTDAVAAAAHKGDDGMHDAAHAMNKSALIASDAGMADLARDLCWQHINAYRDLGRPLTFLECRYMLEPVHNLARLQIRAAQGTPALDVLESLHQAVTRRRDLTVDEQTLPTSNLVGEHHDEQSLRQWVWQQLIADGVRALALANRWPDAAAHASRHNGIGDHLLEGRQAAIIAHLVQNQTGQAADRLAQTTLTEPWETEVAPCLQAMCAAAAADEKTTIQHLETAHQRLRARTQGHHYVSYRTRLGLTIATLAYGAHPTLAAKTAVQTTEEAINAADGYAARDVLGCTAIAASITSRQHHELTHIATSSGLGHETVSQHDTQRLTETSTEATALLSAALHSAKEA
jgi:hypothetical protein